LTNTYFSIAVMEAFPVLDIHTGNVRDVWPSLKLGIMTADFIALDLVSYKCSVMVEKCVCVDYLLFQFFLFVIFRYFFLI